MVLSNLTCQFSKKSEKMAYNFNEYVDMLLCLGASNNNASEAARDYARLYPQRRHPDAKVIRRLMQRLRENGQIMPLYVNRGRPREVRTPALEEAILEAIENAPGRSIRGLAREFHVDYRRVQGILADEHYHPYHYVKVQALRPGDYPLRVEFCEWLLGRHRIEPRFIQNILWTDESYFSQDGIFNQHNNHIWATENPFAVHPRAHQHRFGINLWAGVIDNNLVGPFTLPARVNAENFLQFLQNDFQVLLEDLPLVILRQMWLQMDGAPPHFGRIVRDWCNETYPNRWIGRGGAIAWPPRSPDLNPCDFFLWGHLQNFVYATPIANLEELTERINAAVNTINVPMLQRVQENIVRRAALCIEVGGRNFEQLL
jgi:transposase